MTVSWRSGIYHNPSGIYLKVPPKGLGTNCVLRIRAPREAPIEKVFLRCAPDGEQEMIRCEAASDIEGYDCRWWEAKLHLRNPRLHYRFFLLTREGGHWFGAAGLTRHVPTDYNDFQILAAHHTPSWLEKTVFYQIFPDRFADGDPSNNVRTGGHKVDGNPAVARKWGELPNVHQGWREFFGGDLQGITGHLDYLQDTLGVNALYLNPICTAPSSHKYDVASYTEVDPCFGGEVAFLELKRALERRGMRLILDFVPNHCGAQHPWFREAQANPEAETRQYFTFHRHPHDFDCWMGHRSLPKLNYANQRLREVMYADPDSIMRSWLKPPRSVDGWRLDVANMLARQGAAQLTHKILRGMRRAVKAENPDCYLLGENFFDASPYLQGDQLDATMNYRGFMMPLYHWLTGRDQFAREWADNHPLSSEDLVAQWREWRSTVPWRINAQQFNLLDSHDTPRLLNLVSGDRSLAATARLILFTYPGVPCIYYGDELALEGGRDPDNRRTMNWNSSQWDRQWLDGWSHLVRLRIQLEALRRGSFQTVLAEESTLAYVRETRAQRLVIIARRGPDSVDRIPVRNAAIPDRVRFRDHLSGREATVEDGYLAVPPDFTQLWEQLP